MAKVTKTKGKVRIIGGMFGSRHIHFISTPKLRPSPDVVRETLFNWLSPYIAQSKCLDLYAGSGIFGFEALSRGAQTITLVDNNLTTVNNLKDNAIKLGVSEKACIIHGHAEKHIASANQQYDIIFLDPPFDEIDYQKLFESLIEYNVITPNGLIYLECKKSTVLPSIIPTWHIIRQKTQGMVQSVLIET